MFKNVVICCAVLLGVVNCKSAKPPGGAITQIDDRHYVVTRTPVPPRPSKADLLAHKPPHLPTHAHLWESNQNDNFMIYGWVAYDGRVGAAAHNVHHLRVYLEDGSSYFQGYYVVVPAPCSKGLYAPVGISLQKRIFF